MIRSEKALSTDVNWVQRFIRQYAKAQRDNKKQSEAEFLNDLKNVPQVYVQDVRQLHSNKSISQSSNDVNGESELDNRYFDALKSGDMNSVQEMVNKAAIDAGGMTLATLLFTFRKIYDRIMLSEF